MIREIALVMGFVGVALNAAAQDAIQIPLNPQMCCDTKVADGVCYNTKSKAMIGVCVDVLNHQGAWETMCELETPFIFFDESKGSPLPNLN